MKDEKKTIVELAGQDFVIRRIPMARVGRIGQTLAKIVGDVQTLDLKESENATQVILDKVLQFPYEILSLFIDNLPEEIFKDEENGVDFPEFLDALHAAVELNRIDALKNFFVKMAPLMIQANTLQKAK